MLPVCPDVGIKSSSFFQFVPQSSFKSFYLKVTFFKIAQKVAEYLGYFCEKNCCQGLSEIVQSGHTATYLPTYLMLISLKRRTDLYCKNIFVVFVTWSGKSRNKVEKVIFVFPSFVWEVKLLLTSCQKHIFQVWWLWEETHGPKVVGSNPGTKYQMDIFSHIFVVKIVMMFV